MAFEGISVKKEENMPEWYSEVILKSGFADTAPVRGCMIIRPDAYAVWQSITDYFNKRLKTLQVQNAYFPLFIPEKFFKKEAEHAKGFSPEVAWVENKDEKEDKIAVRPTSETIIYDSYSKWIRSWRDLPLRMNQWCNIVRWEVKDVKLFLRSREFLWQEGHCAYETEKECETEALAVLDEYKKLSEDLLAIPVLKGEKTPHERFAGAKKTFTIEAFMPDGKALQMGTSHNLGQGFAKSFNMKFKGKDEKEHYVWNNSWGFSTRLIGSLILMHGDNKGLVMPPNVAPTQIVIIPILFDKTKEKVLAEARKIKTALKKYRVELDDRDSYSPGWKYNQHELKGVPIRIELGPKDLEKKHAIVVRRDTGKKQTVPLTELQKTVEKLLDEIQTHLFKTAEKQLKKSIVKVTSDKDLIKTIDDKKMAQAPFCLDIECEEKLKQDTNGITTRCIARDTPSEKKCVCCDKQATKDVYFARNY